MYFSELSNVFVQISKCNCQRLIFDFDWQRSHWSRGGPKLSKASYCFDCQDCKMYVSKFSNICFQNCVCLLGWYWHFDLLRIFDVEHLNFNRHLSFDIWIAIFDLWYLILNIWLLIFDFGWQRLPLEQWRFTTIKAA